MKAGHGVGEHMILTAILRILAEGVGKSEVPPESRKYTSLRASVAECLDHSTWGSFGSFLVKVCCFSVLLRIEIQSNF